MPNWLHVRHVRSHPSARWLVELDDCLAGLGVRRNQMIMKQGRGRLSSELTRSTDETSGAHIMNALSGCDREFEISIAGSGHRGEHFG